MPRRSPTLSKPPLLSQVGVVLSDVDGVLTDGHVFYFDHGETATLFSIQDGMRIWLGRQAGLRFGWLSGRKSEAVAKRARELQIDYLALGVRDKGKLLKKWQKREKWQKSELLYIGDDLNDLPLFSLVGTAVAVENAVPEVKRRADWVLKQRGGHGALREVVEQILKAKGAWQAVQRMFA